MKKLQFDRVKFFVFLNLTIVLTFLGSPTYAGIELEKRVLDSIKSAKTAPDLRKFPDDKMKQIFQDIAKNNENVDAKPFIERIRDYKNSTKENPDDVLDKLEYNYSENIDNIPTLLNEICGSCIRGKGKNAQSDFNNLITITSYLGNKINQNNKIPTERKDEVFENISNIALKLYSTILNQNPMSLKKALARWVKHDNSNFFERLAMCFRL